MSLCLPFQDNFLFVVSDIHGDVIDFIYYLNLWLRDKSNHIVFMGDLIHADSKEADGSLLILDIIKEFIDCPTFHVLLGNHELSQLLGDGCYRYCVNQVDSFKELVEEAYPNDYSIRYKEYKKLLSKFDYFLTTSNGLFISHTGMNENYLEYILNGSVDIYDLDYNDGFEKEFLTEWLWSRPYDDYMEDTITKTLTYYNCDYWVCGHTNYNGCHILGDQLIFDSSHNTENKYYLQIQLNKKYHNIIEILQNLKKREEGE